MVPRTVQRAEPDAALRRSSRGEKMVGAQLLKMRGEAAPVAPSKPRAKRGNKAAVVPAAAGGVAAGMVAAAAATPQPSAAAVAAAASAAAAIAAAAAAAAAEPAACSEALAAAPCAPQPEDPRKVGRGAVVWARGGCPEMWSAGLAQRMTPHPCEGCFHHQPVRAARAAPRVDPASLTHARARPGGARGARAAGGGAPGRVPPHSRHRRRRQGGGQAAGGRL
jgi:hypothetical protein